MFLGFLGLVLAIVAVLRPPEDLLSRRRVLVLASLTVVMALLSFGPQTRGAHPWPLPYALLYHLVPGFKGLRAVARLAVMVALGLAVLAGYGMAALARRWPRRQAVVGVLLCVLAVAEGGIFAPGGVILPVGTDVPAHYRWFAPPAPRTVLAYLPIPQLPLARAFTESTRQFFAAANWQPLLNGYSGFTPPLYERALVATRGFPSRSSVAWLRAQGVQAVIVEKAACASEDDYLAARNRLDHFADQLRLVQEDEEAFAVELGPMPGRP